MDCAAAEPEADVVVRMLAPGSSVYRLENVADRTWLQIDEIGVDLTVRDPAQPDTDAIQVGSQPSRLGRWLAPAREGQRIVISSRPATTRLPAVGHLQLHCRAPPAIEALARCQTEADQASNEDAAIAIAAASPPFCAATALHVAAAAAARADQAEAAEHLFHRAAERWRLADEPGREAAARIRAAEMQWRQGRYEPSLAEATAAERLASQAGIGYYAARAHNQRCLGLRGLGRFDAARDCVRAQPALFLALGELSEAANALFNQAAMANEDGRPEDARAALAQARALPEPALTPMVRGRLAHVEAGLESGAGRVQSALNLLDLALRHFELAGSTAWRAHTYLHAARLHAVLGADAEALLLTESADRIYNELGLSERQTVAALLHARVLAERGDVDAALIKADRAMVLGTGTSPQMRLDIATFAWSLQATPARQQAVEDLIGQGLEWTPRQRFDVAAAKTLHALATEQVEHALASLDGIEADIPDLHRRTDYERLRARIEAATGRPDAARTRLDAAINRIVALAGEAGTAALRQIAGRRLLELRAAWIDTIAPSEWSRPDLAAEAERMLLSTDPGRLLLPAEPPSMGPDPWDAGDRLDLILARALTGDGGEQDLLAAQRTLWARYASAGDRQPNAAATPTAQELPRQLPTGSVVLLLGLGQRQSLALSFDHEQAQLHRLADAGTVQRSAARLIELASRRDSPLAQVDESARALSDLLLPNQAGAVPERLLILVDESLAAVPYSLLRWPGQPGPLLETTRVSLMSSAQRVAIEDQDRDRRDDLQVLFSASAVPVADGRALPRLYGAELEASWIADAVSGSRVHAAALTGNELRVSLRRAGAWVHVAGHGSVRDGLQGHAGLWGEPEPGDEPGPQFISWLDLLDQPLSAGLVVLNACALGDTGAARRNRASSFAAAVQAAGAEHVIAALWPVSDSAAALWIPAFYRSLSEAGDDAIDPADALRRAQLRLRDSRAFRHPFYWASLSHYGSLPVR